ncbi:unnamed protein product, partial [Ectocarpus fasciculatus]
SRVGHAGVVPRFSWVLISPRCVAYSRMMQRLSDCSRTDMNRHIASWCAVAVHSSLFCYLTISAFSPVLFIYNSRNGGVSFQQMWMLLTAVVQTHSLYHTANLHEIPSGPTFKP